MPDAKFAKPWHGIPREEIEWHPSVDDDACIGCGTCVTGCSRKVYRFDFARKKAVVADPLNCMVACMTCANTCPTNAISFPPVRTILDLADRVEVHHAVEDELLERRDELAVTADLLHEDHIVEMVVQDIAQIGSGTRLLTLSPRRERDEMCQFVPGQYIEVWVPGASWMSRAYSIANAPRLDGSIEVQIRKVDGGRLSAWAFGAVAVGDVVAARGPLGSFTMRSPEGRPVIFVARGTGFAPIKALLEQQVELFPEREMVLFWGATSSDDFYELDHLAELAGAAAELSVTLVARRYTPGFSAPSEVVTELGRVSDAVASSGLDLAGFDAYVAGPRLTVVDCVAALGGLGIDPSRVFVDSYGA
ncbi:MAG: FAD-binding oxidoreductase [Actinomycetota bacterium]|jgi:CDP-4-dehydro-6-deoxyglucose reductase|nr:FAD-binding oxidoreductase [Actinomycetota bacterium]